MSTPTPQFDIIRRVCYNIADERDHTVGGQILPPERGGAIMFVTLSDMVQLGILICAIVGLLKQKKTKHKKGNSRPIG